MDLNGTFGLVIDTGTTIVGMTRLIDCEGVVGSFNGNRHGLDDLTLIAGPATKTSTCAANVRCIAFWTPKCQFESAERSSSTSSAPASRVISQECDALRVGQRED